MSRCDLLSLQGKAKRDPEGYRDDVLMQLQHYNALHWLFLLKPGNDFREFADLVGLLAEELHEAAPQCHASRGSFDTAPGAPLAKECRLPGLKKKRPAGRCGFNSLHSLGRSSHFLSCVLVH